MSAQNCLNRTKPTSFSVSFDAVVDEYNQWHNSFSSTTNEGITERELACDNLLALARNRVVGNNKSFLLLKSKIPKKTNELKYPYPNYDSNVGYNYFNNVELFYQSGVFQNIIVRYLNNPTTELLYFNAVLGAQIVCLTGDSYPLPQSIILPPDSISGNKLIPIARIELNGSQYKITNFQKPPGSGAILYPEAPNDPNPSNPALVRLFESKEAFNFQFSNNGLLDRPCSACDLCGFDTSDYPPNLPESLWNFSYTLAGDSVSGNGFIPYVFFEHNGDSGNILQFVISALNTNPSSPACNSNGGAGSILVTDGFGGGTYYYLGTPLKIGRNVFKTLDELNEATIDISIGYE